MIKYFIINGYPRAGKDTFVEFCADYLQGTVVVVNLSTVDFVKRIAKMCGWNGEKTPKNREFLSNLKDLLTDWDDVPFKKILEEIEKQKLNNLGANLFFFIHCREPKEINKLKSELGASTIFIQRNQDALQSNHADSDVELYDYDFYIENNSTLKEFRQKAKDLMEKEIILMEKEKGGN